MRIVLAYKNFAAHRNVSHIGLGVAAINTAKVLCREGIATEVWPIRDAADLRSRLRLQPVEHVIISAPWIPSAELQSLSVDYSSTRFVVNCHSNVGFLQADRNGVKLVRELMDLEMGIANLHLAGNSHRFCRWIHSAFGSPCIYLPNLCWLHSYAARPLPWSGGTLRIGAFGATRPLKNLMSAAGAALDIARHFRAPLELYLSSGRTEINGEAVLGAVQEMLHDLPGVIVNFSGWQSWPAFRRLTAHMHLLLQPSYTESFNIVTADGIAEGVPSVVSPAIDWAPDDWKANSDDVLDIARVGRRLLHDARAVDEGRAALERYIADGICSYRQYLATR